MRCYSLTVNNEMTARAMSNSKSDPISLASRLGATLIMLGGGRRIGSRLVATICLSKFQACCKGN